MIKQVKKKLKSAAGESLAEVLIALLIAALAMTMLASVISTAARLINQSKNTMDQYYAANEELNTRVHDASANLTTAGTNKEIKIKIAVNDATIDFLPSGSDFKVSYIVNSRVSGKDVICYWVPVTSP